MPYDLELIPDGVWIADQLNNAIIALQDFLPHTPEDGARLKLLLATLAECEIQMRQLIENESIFQALPPQKIAQ